MASFKDSRGVIGRPRLAPQSEIEVQAEAGSRSLDQINKELEKKIINCEIKRGSLFLSLQLVHGNRVRIRKAHALKLAKWIIDEFTK